MKNLKIYFLSSIVLNILVLSLFLTGFDKQDGRTWIGNGQWLKDSSSRIVTSDNFQLTGEVLTFNVNRTISDIYIKDGLGVNLLLWDNTTATFTQSIKAVGMSISGTAFIEDLVCDSIFVQRNSAQQNIIQDDGIIIINSSFVWIRSDNPVATDRTFALPNGTTIGQVVKILFFLSGSDQCELHNGGNVLTKDGATRTFDVDREMMVFTWDGNFWVEDGRSL